MKKLIIYYSYSGHTEQLAKDLAAKEGADLCKVLDQQRKGKLGAYVSGSLAAMRLKSTPIQPILADLSTYDKIIVLSPIWAGKPAPAINNVFDQLPSGKEVEVRMVSASGNSSAKDAVRTRVEKKGCKFTGFQDIKAN